jgi:hypothetical protein
MSQVRWNRRSSNADPQEPAPIDWRLVLVGAALNSLADLHLQDFERHKLGE